MTIASAMRCIVEAWRLSDTSLRGQRVNSRYADARTSQTKFSTLGAAIPVGCAVTYRVSWSTVTRWSLQKWLRAPLALMMAKSWNHFLIH